MTKRKKNAKEEQLETNINNSRYIAQIDIEDMFYQSKMKNFEYRRKK